MFASATQFGLTQALGFVTNNLATSRMTRILAIPFGLFFAALGTIALLSVLGVLKSSVPTTYTYQVFGVCASAVFIASGIGVALFGLGLHRVAAQLGGLALLFFLITFNWIAFGPGDRKFTTKTSSSFSKVVVRPASELEGRFVFGLVALLMDSILIYGLVKGHRNKT